MNWYTDSRQTKLIEVTTHIDKRTEDPALITGRGRFVADLVPADALWCWYARSPFAHGEILDIDTDFATDTTGVVAVHTADDLGLRDIPGTTGRGPEAAAMTRPPLARGRVRYVGEAVAVVVAERAAQAEDGAGAVFADIEPLPVAADIDAALRGETVLFDANAGGNIVASSRIEHGAPPLAPDLISITVPVVHARLAPAPIEALAILAEPDGDGGLHVYVTHQAPHRIRDQLASFLDLDPASVRVTVPDVGGAFGMKGMFFPEYLVTAKVALLHDRPAVWVQPRREHFTGGTHGRSQRHTVTLRADDSGAIQSAEFDLVTDCGAYPHNGAQIGAFSRLVATGLYDIPHVAFDWAAVVTNRAPVGSYRGAGRPEAAVAIERAMDVLAAELRLDPAELRRRNFITELPHRTTLGAEHDSGDYAAALERALVLADYEAVRAEQATRISGKGPLLGIGIGAFIERAGGAPDSAEYGAVSIDAEGAITVRTGSTTAGQGHATVWRRLVAEVFDVDPSRVAVISGDTAEVANSVGSFASRSAQIGGSAVFRVAERVRDRARQLAADLLEAEPNDLVLRNGAFEVVGVPGTAVTLAETAQAAEAAGEPLADDEFYSPGAQTFPYGAHIAIVEVDRETGLVSLRLMVTVDDVGNVLNEMIVEGQLHGSLLQGIGAALSEEVQYDSEGQPLATTFVDYLVPHADQSLHLISERINHPAPSNPLGVKGAGEGGSIGAPAAILNAAADALAPLGVRELQLPLQPRKVWEAIQAVSRA